MMTGEPRSATVWRRPTCCATVWTRARFADTLGRRPEIAEDIAGLLAERKTALMQARHELDAEASKSHPPPDPHELLHRIRAFFHL